MLTRQEEFDRSMLDNHLRFPATASHAYRHGYLDKPVVDEWLIVLGHVIKSTWPNCQISKNQYRIRVSHDVDNPSLYGFKNWQQLLRLATREMLAKRNVHTLLLAPWIKIHTKNRINKRDPANTFDWLMTLSESRGLVSSFNFMWGKTDPKMDVDYNPEHPAIRALLRRISQRGHEIGLHPSYGTYKRPDLLKLEAERMRKIAREENIKQTIWGGRMHYLRWEQPVTLRAWNDAGMTYDSTLGYADQPGFRCGTCFEYTAFDSISDKVLSLRLRPLIAMDTTIINQEYLGLGPGELALNKIERLKQTCKKVGGTFTLLWHNCQLQNTAERLFYKRVIS
jgi:hypothetical protein